MPFGADQSAACEDAEVRRHCVLRHVELSGYLPGGEAVRFVPYQQAEHIKARTLRERAQHGDCRIIIHISRIEDI